MANRLGKYIIDLTDLWFNWVENDNCARGMSGDIHKRSRSVDKCEILMEKRRNIVNNINEQINDEFNKKRP
jgi:hypothetical protein